PCRRRRSRSGPRPTWSRARSRTIAGIESVFPIIPKSAKRSFPVWFEIDFFRAKNPQLIFRAADTRDMKRIGRFATATRDAVLALFFPARCRAGDADCPEGAAFCELCADTLEPIERGCPRCGLPLAGDQEAQRCLGCVAHPPSYAWARAPF